jgi:hypothetical protein
MNSVLALLGGAVLGVAGAVTMSKRAADREPVAMLAVNGKKTQPRATTPRATVAQPEPETPTKNPMDFNGWAPEVINGRLAQVGFVAAIAGEVTTQQTLAQQFQTNFDAFAISAILVMVGSFAPSVQRAVTSEYDENGARSDLFPKKLFPGAAFSPLESLVSAVRKERAQINSDSSNPKNISPSADPFGIFKESSELTNSRAAMVGIAAMLVTEAVTQHPIFMLSVEGEASDAKPRVPAPQATVAVPEGPSSVEPQPPTPPQPNPMNANSWAPEVINGRLAQVGFVAAIGSELTTGQSLATQFQSNFGLFAGSVVVVTLASFAPGLQMKMDEALKVKPKEGYKYSSDPQSIDPKKDPFGIFSYNSEMTNNRAAMVGIAAMLATELAINRPIFMLGVEGKETPAASLNPKLRAWAEKAGALLRSDGKTMAMLGLSGVGTDNDDEPAIPTELSDAFKFGGWAPEVINGRLAQLGFVAALGTEITNPGETLAMQFGDNFPLFAASVLGVTAASFFPQVYNTNGGTAGYSADPKSIPASKDPFGVFSYNSEMTNSRAAMVGIVAMLATEQLLQRPIIMMGVQGKQAQLNQRLHAWAAEAGADLMADEQLASKLFVDAQ